MHFSLFINLLSCKPRKITNVMSGHEIYKIKHKMGKKCFQAWRWTFSSKTTQLRVRFLIKNNRKWKLKIFIPIFRTIQVWGDCPREQTTQCIWFYLYLTKVTHSKDALSSHEHVLFWSKGNVLHPAMEFWSMLENAKYCADHYL